ACVCKRGKEKPWLPLLGAILPFKMPSAMCDSQSAFRIQRLVTHHSSLITFLSVVLVLAAGCRRSSNEKVVTLYCSVDEPFARQIVSAFEKESGIRVRLRTDTEAGKTTGLVRLIEAERNRPQADVFWSSELFNTIKMAQDGLLAEYRPRAEGIPDR